MALIERTLFAQDFRNEARTELIRLATSWTPVERRRAIGTALAYLRPWYADRVHRNVILIAAMERDDGMPQLREWLRVHCRSTDRGVMQVLANILPMTVILELPETFDAFSFWVHSWGERGGASAVLSMQKGRGMEARTWMTWDEAAQSLGYVFREFIPERIWDYCYLWEMPDTERLAVMKERRDSILKWLQDHPEARSWWIQKYYHSHLERRDGMISQEHYFRNRLPRVEAAIAALEKEFPEELADRRGICADAKWNRPEKR